jgi:two-component system sensor histidine kinase YesM
MLQRLSNIKIYQKTLLVFLLVFVPFFAISICINILEGQYIRNKSMDSLESKVSFYSQSLNNEIEHVKMQQWQMINTQSILKLSMSTQTMKYYEQVNLMNDVLERLNTLKNSSAYVDDVMLYISSPQLFISVQQRIRDSVPQAYQLLGDYYASDTNTSIFNYQNDLYLIEPLFKDRNDIKAPVDTLYIKISGSNLINALEPLLDYNNSVAALTDGRASYIASSSLGAPDDEVLQKAMTFQQADGQYDLFTMRHQQYMTVRKHVEYIGMDLIVCVPVKEITGELNKYTLWLSLLLLFSVACIILFVILINKLIHRPMQEFVNAFKQLEANHLDVQINYGGNDEFGYLYSAFNKMVIKLNQFIRENYEQKIAMQQSELKQLQSQINPHFLYNSFFHIYSLCKCEDIQTILLFSQKLGTYYQFLTRNGQGEVPLITEFRHARDYVDIQNIRFSNRINVHFGEVPSECQNMMVLKLILQPVIENSYEHGFANKLEGGFIRIDTIFDNNILSIVVEDNGDGMSDADLALLQNNLADAGIVEKTGIINVNRRLHLRYGDKSGLQVEKSEYGGLKVTMIICFTKEETDVQIVDR